MPRVAASINQENTITDKIVEKSPVAGKKSKISRNPLKEIASENVCEVKIEKGADCARDFKGAHIRFDEDGSQVTIQHSPMKVPEIIDAAEEPVVEDDKEVDPHAWEYRDTAANQEEDDDEIPPVKVTWQGVHTFFDADGETIVRVSNNDYDVTYLNHGLIPVQRPFDGLWVVQCTNCHATVAPPAGWPQVTCGGCSEILPICLANITYKAQQPQETIQSAAIADDLAEGLSALSMAQPEEKKEEVIKTEAPVEIKPEVVAAPNVEMAESTPVKKATRARKTKETVTEEITPVETTEAPVVRRSSRARTAKKADE